MAQWPYLVPIPIPLDLVTAGTSPFVGYGSEWVQVASPPLVTPNRNTHHEVAFLPHTLTEIMLTTIEG